MSQSRETAEAATSATFSDLAGLAVDNAGDLYIADGAGFQVRRVAPNGIITRGGNRYRRLFGR